MRTSPLFVLQTVAFTTILTGLIGTFFPLYGQVAQDSGPMRQGAFSEPVFPVGAPLLVASRENPDDADLKTRPPEVEDWSEPEPKEKESGKEKSAKTAIAAWFSSFKKPSNKKQDVQPDDGLEVVEWMNDERNYSEKDYVESAVKGGKTSSADFYSRGMQAENDGNLDEAARCYNAFIKANGKQTENGALAAPYHRLALIAWKGQRNREADIYFRYGMKYAQGGNLSIIAGDYALFLMERNETAKAEVMLRNALGHSPENHRLLVYLGRCAIRQDRPVEALRHFTAAVGSEQAYVEMAHEYRKMGEWESALKIDEKRNEFIAQRMKRATPPRPYDERPPMPYPMPQAGPATQYVTVPGPVSIPSVSHQPQTVTPVSMISTPESGPAPPNASGPNQGWQPHPSANMPGVYRYPANSSVPVFQAR